MYRFIKDWQGKKENERKILKAKKLAQIKIKKDFKGITSKLLAMSPQNNIQCIPNSNRKANTGNSYNIKKNKNIFF